MRTAPPWTDDRCALAADLQFLTLADELACLVDQIGVREFADTAPIAHRAVTQGAHILDSLSTKAASLREQQLATVLGSPAYARIVDG